MRTSELIEMAALEALGLLDDDEQSSYERALAAAPSSVRRQVREQQQRAAEFEASLLPDVEPTPELRRRVLEAVARAKQEQEASGARSVVHRPGRVVPKVPSARRVSPLWRAASIGLAIAVVALSVISIQLQEYATRLGDAVVVNQIFNKVGTRQVNDTLFDRNTERLILTVTAASPAPEAKAVVLTNPDWRSARFICADLSGERGALATFALCVVDDQDQIVSTIKRFDSEGRWVSFDIAADSVNGGRLAVVTTTPAGLGDIVMIARG